jgi:hypothetical protein
VIGLTLLSLLTLAGGPTVTSASDCPSARDIESNLSALLPEQWAQPGTVTVWPTADGLVIDLRPKDPALAAQRRVVVGSNCEERAKAAAVVIATWWPAEGARPGQGVAAEARPEERVRGFAVAAGGYASIVSGSVAPGARLEAWLAPRETGFGVRLAAGATLSHEDTLGQGAVSWFRASLELGPTYSLRFLHVDAGLVASVLWVGGSGFAENRNDSGAMAGLTLGLRAVHRWGRVEPWLELRGVAWPETQQMYVTDAATGLRANRPLPNAELQVGAGIALSLF